MLPPRTPINAVVNVQRKNQPLGIEYSNCITRPEGASSFLNRALVLLFFAIALCSAKADLIGNGGFESGLANWTASGSFFYRNNSARAHLGSQYAYFGVASDGITGLTNGAGSIYQTVTIPLGATSAGLAYWLWVASDDSATVSFDYLYLEILENNGSLLTTAAVYSNTNKSGAFLSSTPAYVQKTNSLLAYAGQTIRVRFRGTTDPSYNTIFRLDDVSLQVNGPLPVVQTTPASHITPTSAVLNGSLNPNGTSSSFYFQYGTTIPYDNSTAIGNASIAINVAFTNAALSPSTIYHYRLVGYNFMGTNFGTDSSFVTQDQPPPTVHTLGATTVTLNSAHLNGTVNPNGASTQYFFQYDFATNGPGTTYANVTPQVSIGNGNTILNESTSISIVPNRGYHYRIGAVNIFGGLSYGADTNFAYANFSLAIRNPIVGESLQAGSQYTIGFSNTDITGSIAFYDLAYTLDGGNTYTTINGNINSAGIGYLWTIPCASTAQAQIRLRAFDSCTNVLTSTNTGNFTIAIPSGFLVARADVTTTSPSPGQPVVFSATRSQTAPCAPITLYTWTFPDGTISGPNDSTVIRTFSVPPQSSTSFIASLAVQDSAGNTSTAYLPITVSGWGQGVSSSSSFSHDPVNLANGNYIFSHKYLKMPGKGFPFDFGIFYNSQFADQTAKPLGYGWTHSYNIFLSSTSTNATVTYGDGHSEIYYQVNGQYEGAFGVFSTLATNSDSTFAVTTKDRTKQNFNSQGQLASIVDKNGNSLILTYSNGVLTNITDTADRQIIFQNDAQGRVTQIIDPIGRSIQFQYDGLSNLVAAVDANLGTNIFVYDTNHQMTGARDARGTLFVQNAYDSLQRVVSYQSDAYTNQSAFYYDFANHITYSTNALGKVSIYRHDVNLLVTNIVDEAGSQQFFSYDTNRNRIFIQDKNGNQTQYGYDPHGNVTNKIDALTNVTTIEYDALNNPVRRIDVLGNATTFGYDLNGNLTSTTNTLGFVSTVQYDTNGLPMILTDARGFSIKNLYDSQGNLVAVTDAAGFSSRFEFDAVGRKIREIDALNRTNSSAFDDNDNLVYATNALNFVNAFTYDANNNQVSSRDPRNAAVTNIFDLKDRQVAVLASINYTNGTVYDALDRKIASFDALGNQTCYAYDDVGGLIGVTNALNQVTRFSYDPNGNQISATDPTGHSVTNVFDALNRKVAVVDVSISTNFTVYDALGRIIATTNALGQVTRFFYDAIGRLTKVVDSADQSVYLAYNQNGNRVRITDPGGHTWTNIFDGLNRLIEQRNPDGTKTVFSYDPVGNLTNKFTPNGDSITYGYDAANRLTNITYPSGPPVAIAYDEVGNRTNMIDSLGATTWQYDLLNRLLSVTDPHGETVVNSFDANGNRVSLTYPGNKTVNYGFDALNRMTALTNWQNGVVNYSYDTQGNLISTTHANGTTAAYVYDAANRLIALTNTSPSAGVIAAYALALDSIGNQRQETREQPLFPILPNQTNNYAYNSDNRLLTIDGQIVTHNLNGNLTAIGTNATYAYDFADRLVQFAVTNVSGTCSYDGLGNRLARTVNGQIEHFVLDRMGALTQVLAEVGTNGSPISYYVYGLGLAQRISANGAVATYHFDIQSSTIAITDSGGNVTDSYAYDSFGVLANSDGGSAQPFHYLGRYGIMDDGNSLLYARARYFSPQLGRFLTKDPVTGKDSDSQSLNRYVYALNNPVRFRDTSGFTAQEFNGSSHLSWSEFLVETSFFTAEKGGEYLLRLKPGNRAYEIFEDLARHGHSIDFRGLGFTLNIAGKAFSVYSTSRGFVEELGSRGVTFNSFIDSYRNIGANIEFGLQHGDVLLDAATKGVTSATAFTLNTLSLGLLNVHGEDVERLVAPTSVY